MGSTYVQYGCGLATGQGWLNFDSSPNLRIQRVPVVGQLAARLAGNYVRFPDAVQYGDIVAGLPIAPGSAIGVYASHVLEHLAHDDFLLAIRNTFKIMQPGGTFRLIVPDLESRARLYLQDIANGSPDANSRFMRVSDLGLEARPKKLMSKMRQLYGGSLHLWMWDEVSIAHQLKAAGFVDVRRCTIGDSGDPLFDQVENPERFIDPTFNLVECAVSARKPL